MLHLTLHRPSISGLWQYSLYTTQYLCLTFLFDFFCFQVHPYISYWTGLYTCCVWLSATALSGILEFTHSYLNTYLRIFLLGYYYLHSSVTASMAQCNRFVYSAIYIHLYIFLLCSSESVRLSNPTSSREPHVPVPVQKTSNLTTTTTTTTATTSSSSDSIIF